MLYFVKTPGWLKKLYNSCIWEMPGDKKKIYLTFDDGPHPVATPFVLDILKRYDAKASFFCIGKNVQANPELYNRIISEGHAVGNHSFNHLNGWKTKTADYLLDIAAAKKYIDTRLFRPPYGRITRAQSKALAGEDDKMAIIMWTVLSGDFDVQLAKEKCLHQVISKTGNGSIVVFHDSAKAYDKLVYTLPGVLAHFAQLGFDFEKIVL